MTDSIIQETLRRGTLELVLLSMLKDGDKYGYEIVRELFARSNGTYMLQEGSMYPSLYRLLDRGLISDRKEQVGKKRTRVYYHLTDAGEKYLEELIKGYYEIRGGVEAVINFKPEADEEVMP